MKKFVAKVSRRELLESKFAIANRMAGKMDPGDFPWRFITEDQVRQMERYRITVFRLTNDDHKRIEQMRKDRELRKKSKKQVPIIKYDQIEITVEYRDEDREYFTQTFKSEAEFNSWKRSCEMRESSGEVIDIINIIRSERVY